MNPYLILGVVFAVGVAGAGGLYQGHKLGKAEVQQQWDKEKAEQLAAYAKAQEEARAKEQALQAQADQLRKESYEQIKDINARSDKLINSLRQRPERSTQTSSVSNTAESCSGASGKELASRDAIFLAGYSADAARLQAALDTCIKQYEALRK
jgi:alkanesulfonate monooxygenase SsuD/methylene tetrahydromethanopterin reductase-like flavin-dependent oxidoreductase (luciferase family)